MSKKIKPMSYGDSVDDTIITGARGAGKSWFVRIADKLNEVIAQVNANTQTINEFFKDAQPKAEPTKTYTEDEVAEMLYRAFNHNACYFLPNEHKCPELCEEYGNCRTCWKMVVKNGLLKGAEG